MEVGLVRFARYSMAILAAGVALWSARYWAALAGSYPLIDADIHRVIENVPVQALTHMLVGPVALVTGPFQFIPGLRARRPQLHRWTGRTYIVACLIAGVAALATAPFASGGPFAGLGFGLLAVSWITANIGGWRAALAGNFAAHRIWMRFSYAMTFGAVTLRLQIPIGLAFLGFHSYSQMSVWLAYTSWIPNVIAVALYTAMKGGVPAAQPRHA